MLIKWSWQAAISVVLPFIFYMELGLINRIMLMQHSLQIKKNKSWPWPESAKSLSLRPEPMASLPPYLWAVGDRMDVGVCTRTKAHAYHYPKCRQNVWHSSVPLSLGKQPVNERAWRSFRYISSSSFPLWTKPGVFFLHALLHGEWFQNECVCTCWNLTASTLFGHGFWL